MVDPRVHSWFRAGRTPRRRLGAFGLMLVLVVAGCVPALPPDSAIPRLSAQLPRPATRVAGDEVVRSHLSLPPLPFVENAGHADSRVAFFGRAGAMTAYYGSGSIAYGVVGHDADLSSETERAARTCAARWPKSAHWDCGEGPTPTRWWLTQDLVGARTVPPTSLEAAEAVVSLLVPPAPRPALAGHHRLIYADAWDGIDVVLDHAAPRALKATYLVEAGVDPSQIRVRWRGGKASLLEDGTLELRTPLGVVREAAPVAWQERDGRREPLRSRFVLLDLVDGPAEVAEAEVGIAVDGRDARLPLAIDPTIEFVSYIGGSADDYGSDIAFDATGRVYVSGTTSSVAASFPDGDGFGAISGADHGYNGGIDGFVVRLSADGAAVQYASYLGGTGDDYIQRMVVDASGKVYVVGSAASNELTFPDGGGTGTRPGADRTYNGGAWDGFVARLLIDTPSPSPTATPTVSPTVTLTPTASMTPTGTLTPTATPTPTSTAAPTQPAGACAPTRPPVRLTTTPASGGRLAVTVATDALTLLAIRLGNGTHGPENATVTFADGSSASTSGATYAVPSGQRQTTLTVARRAARPVLVPLVVVDTCGEWPTFVGSGPAGL